MMAQRDSTTTGLLTYDCEKNREPNVDDGCEGLYLEKLVNLIGMYSLCLRQFQITVPNCDIAFQYSLLNSVVRLAQGLRSSYSQQ